jgi:hypothetical protein
MAYLNYGPRGRNRHLPRNGCDPAVVQQFNDPVVTKLIADVERHLAKIGYLRWAETRPRIRQGGPVVMGPPRALIQGWSSGDPVGSRTFERGAA